MESKFTVKIYNLKGNLIDTLFTDSEIITIGSGLYNSIRIQLPSILELHVKIYLNYKKIFVVGEDVKLNDKDLAVGEKLDFEIGDFIKIHGRAFQIELTSPNVIIDQSKIIKECPEYLKDSCAFSYQIESNLFLNGMKSNESNESKLKSIESKLESNKPKSESNKSKLESIESKLESSENNFSINLDESKDKTNGNESKYKTNGNESNDKTNGNESKYKTNGNESNDKTNWNESKYKTNELTTKIQERIIMNENKEEIKNILNKDDNIITTEENEDFTTKRETNIQTEVISSHFIKDGIIYEEVKEKININDIQEIEYKDKGNNEDIKDNFELQTAIKIIDGSSSETKAEEALEEGNLSEVKEAILSKQQDLNEEIKEVIDLGVVDTPINPLIVKKQVKDLGDVVIEKEILKDAEKVVEEKINQSSESLNLTVENDKLKIKQSENDPSTKMTEIERLEDSLDKIQESVENKTNLPEEQKKDKPNLPEEQKKEQLKEMNEIKLDKNTEEGSNESYNEEIKVDNKNEIEEKSKEEEASIERKNEEGPVESKVEEDPVESREEEKRKNEEKSKEEKNKNEEEEKIVKNKNEEKNKEEEEEEKSKEEEEEKSKEEEDEKIVKNKKSKVAKKSKPKKESKSGFEKLEVENKPSSISKLTVTPRSTRKASMAANKSIETSPVTTSKRVKRNASLIGENKKSKNKK